MGILYGIAPLFVHEGAHYLAALLCGSRLHFEFGWGRLGPIPIPRWTWAWPIVSREKLRVICQAGFVAELALVPLLPWPYAAVALLHFTAYPWYAGNHSDFRGMI